MGSGKTEGFPPGGEAGWLKLGAPALLLLGIGGLVLGGIGYALTLAALMLLAIAAFSLQRLLASSRDDLQDSRQELADLVDMPMQVPFLCDPTGQMTEIGERWESWTGQPLADAFAGRWIERIHPDDQPAIAAAWSSALGNGEPYDQTYRMRFSDGTYRWVRCRALANRDQTGVIRSWTGVLEDDHERHLATERMIRTAGLLEMIGSSTESIIWAKDRDGRMLYINRALERLAGVTLSDVLGRLDVEWNPNRDDAEAFAAADRRVLESGQAEDLEEVFTGANGQQRLYRSIKSPLRNRSGAVIGVVGVATDITERREAEQREQLLARELDHRAKNLLSVVQSLVALTRADTVAEFKTGIQGRIEALGRAHSMLAAARWDGAELNRILEEELAPYQAKDRGRIVLEGRTVVLKPAAAQSLALVIHELATNASKYGALSTAEGRVRISWSVSDAADGPARLAFRWEELGGPPILAPPGTRSGFGSRLISGSIERQLGGSLKLEWKVTGLVASMEVPLDRSLTQPGPGSGQVEGPASPSVGRQAAA